MSTGATLTDRHAPILAELAEMGLSLARAVHEKALAAETPAELAEMTMAFHRISRSVRQTLALEAKLERDRARLEREVRAEAVRDHGHAVLRRRNQVRVAVERLVWTEAEGLEAERLIDELDDILEEEVLSDGFLAEPVEAHIERIRADLGLAADAAGRETSPPPPCPDDLAPLTSTGAGGESGRRSSA
jgi:hypothetical protein